MSNKRTILSRPRTRIYDVNYNIGETYYRPALDRLDRKYTGRPLDGPLPPRATSVPQDILDAHQKAFLDDDMPSARRRAEKAINQPSVFDSRGGRISAAMELLQDQDIDEETASALQRIRANKKLSVNDDLDMDSAVSNITSRRLKQRADGLLDTVGISTVNARSASSSLMDDATSDSIVRRRAVLKITSNQEESAGGSELTKWSALQQRAGAKDQASLEETSATIRARQSRARISELEDEMNDMAEKQAMRERRAARLRMLVSETAADTERENAASSSSTTVKSVRIASRRQRQVVE